MPATPRVPLGAATGNRKWFLDVNTGTIAVPVWTAVHGMTDFKPARDPNMEDDSDFDSEGYQSSTKTAEKWTVEGKLTRKVTVAAPTVYDPGQEFLRAKGEGPTGAANSVGIRYYEMEPGGPRIMAYEGRGAVSWSPEGGDMKALDVVAFKIEGQGKLTAVTHPDVGSLLPVLTSLTPSTGPAAGDTLVTIRGAYFFNVVPVTGVKFDAVNAEEFTVVDSTTIVCDTPAGTGTDQVTVTTAAGVSNQLPFVYT